MNVAVASTISAGEVPTELLVFFGFGTLIAWCFLATVVIIGSLSSPGAGGRALRAAGCALVLAVLWASVMGVTWLLLDSSVFSISLTILAFAAGFLTAAGLLVGSKGIRQILAGLRNRGLD